MLMADPNTNEKKTKKTADRDSSRLKIRERRLQKAYRREISNCSSCDNRTTEAVCARMSLLRI